MAPSYPHPLVIPPLNGDEHSHTIILLHGRSSYSERFGHIFIESKAIAKYLPTTRFVFPTAKKRRSTVLKRVPINQWFDSYSLETQTLELNYSLMDYKKVPRHNGWLPLEEEISGILKIKEDDEQKLEGEAGEYDEEDPFASDTNGEDDNAPVLAQAVNHIRDVLDLPPFQPDTHSGLDDSALHVPIFLGHGSADPKVSVNLGQRMALILSSGFGMDVTWKTYEEFGHWYEVPDEIDDVVRFLKEKVVVPV